MRSGTYGWALLLPGLLAGGIGLWFLGSRVLHIPEHWAAAPPIVLYALVVLAYGWRAGSLRFHACRALSMAIAGLCLLIGLRAIARDASAELASRFLLLCLSSLTARDLRPREAIEAAAQARRRGPWQYVVLAVGILLLVFFVVQAARS